jgi:DNA replication protein DnaC
VRDDLPVTDPAFGKPVPCHCRIQELEHQHTQVLRRYSCLDAFADKTFSTFLPAIAGVGEAWTVAKRYSSNPPGWLLFLGGYGCGKTHLAAAIAHEQMAAGIQVTFAVVPDLLDHLRATFTPSTTIQYDDLFERLREVTILVLDDLGSQSATSWSSEKLFQLLNHRYNFRLPTVITANTHAVHTLDERLASRLSDSGLVRTVVIAAADYRKRAHRLARRSQGE